MHRKQTYRPSVEVLEVRWVPSTFTVTNLRDNGLEEPLIAGSLRRAIDRANSHPGRDSIVFQAGLQGTIKLQLGEILISDCLVLAGPGAAQIKIDGNDNGSIFTVFDNLPTNNAATVRRVTFSGLTLFNGDWFQGGGILNLGEDLTLRRMVIRDNSASSGGGILTVGPLRIEQSRILANQSDLGGGIHARFQPELFSSAPPVVIASSTISDNKADQGGGIELEGGNLTITNSLVANNEAQLGDGGGVRAGAGAEIIASTFRFNRAEGIGGGVAVTSGVQGRLIRSRFVGNSALDGGGVAAKDSDLFVNGCTLFANQSANRGGGIFVNGKASVLGTLIANTTIYRNDAEIAGGGVHSENSVVRCSNSTISGNEAFSAHTFSTGGGFSLVNSNLVASNSTIALNSALSGDGISSEGSAITLRSSICARDPRFPGTDVVGNNTALTLILSLVTSQELVGASSSDFDVTSGELFGKAPLLAPLANNGGPTQTHALKARSPAINKGSNTQHLTTDQRGPGFKRKVGGGVDIGAFERQ
jgi:hypothetical protein